MGFSETIAATSASPFFSGTCATTSCSSDSMGAKVPAGDCICDLLASRHDCRAPPSPFFSGSSS